MCYKSIGTTSEAIAVALLEHNNLRFMTNNLNVAGILMQKTDFHVIVAGGEVRNKDSGIVGEATVDHTKFGRNAMVNIGNVSLVDKLFTDVAPPEELAQVLLHCQTQVHICEPAEEGSPG